VALLRRSQTAWLGLHLTGLYPEPRRLRGDPECPTPPPRGAHCRAPGPSSPSHAWPEPSEGNGGCDCRSARPSGAGRRGRGMRSGEVAGPRPRSGRRERDAWSRRTTRGVALPQEAPVPKCSSRGDCQPTGLPCLGRPPRPAGSSAPGIASEIQNHRSCTRTIRR